MSWISENVTTARDKSWGWFVERAHSKHALLWLALIAFSDAVFSPLVPEAFLAALMLARPDKWKQYLPVAIASSMIGASAGYFIGHFLFALFGAPLLSLYGLRAAFETARHLLAGHVFLAMALASFTPIPDKVFIYAGGFLGVPFLPFIVGYMLGRGARMTIVAYVTGRYGAQILAALNRYFLYVALLVLALFAYYIIVHVHMAHLAHHVSTQPL